MPIRALIVDDEPLARERIRSLLQSEPDVQVAGECADGRKALAAIRKQAPDLLFLDVQMPELDGFGVLKALGAEHMPAVIFVTAYDQYALKAFDAHALDYLLKPFDRERFHRALQRARGHLKRDRTEALSEQLQSLIEYLKVDPKCAALNGGNSGSATPDRLVVKSGGRVFFLKTSEVDWVEAAGNYARLHVAKDSHLLRETMSGLESRLDASRFLRIHRSTIVNVERIKELQPWFHGDYVVILHDGTRLTLSRGYRECLQGLLGKPV
ncbi:MAG: LytR/AlgR family response regulator transcription factor [Terriglobales bacterium]